MALSQHLIVLLFGHVLLKILHLITLTLASDI